MLRVKEIEQVSPEYEATMLIENNDVIATLP
jgi:hypothetical protein